jgi:hypothetical protein
MAFRLSSGHVKLTRITGSAEGWSGGRGVGHVLGVASLMMRGFCVPQGHVPAAGLRWSRIERDPEKGLLIVNTRVPAALRPRRPGLPAENCCVGGEAVFRVRSRQPT